MDDFDRVLAPIFKLEGGARVRALCGHGKTLADRGAALVKVAPARVAGWDDSSREVAGLVGDIKHACSRIPSKAFAGSDDALAEADVASAGDMASALHDAFKKLAALAPDAEPIDSHARDPLPVCDAPATPANLDHLRAALKALDEQVAKLTAVAMQGKARQACAGRTKLPPLYAALAAPDVGGAPANAGDWSGHLGNLGMLIGELDTMCAAGSKTAQADIATHYAGIHDAIAAMLVMCNEKPLR